MKSPQPMEQLSSAYYYAPVAPPKKSQRYHTTSRGGGLCCCCNPFTCLFGCLCTCFCQIIIALLVVVGVIALIFWLIFRPNIIKFHADGASLTEFSLSDNDNTLHYNLALNLSIRNPNQRLPFNYEKIEANAFYRGERFSTVNLTTFHQGTKNTTNTTAVFKGQQVVVLGENKVAKFHEDKDNGAFDIDVRLNIRMRTKYWFINSSPMNPKIDCDLRVPLTADGGVSKAFEPKSCNFLWG